jgi:hypothetical protein
VNGTLDELYLNWLYEFIADPKVANPDRTYWHLAHHLYTKEYFWLIPNDDNRAEDGKFLREEFIETLKLNDDDVDPHWMDEDCSFLEMLIALSRRLSFQGEGEPRDWFWHLIDNLGLDISDRQRFPKSKVDEVLDRIIWRTFSRDGSGGLFPLKHPRRDQRDVEIWSQLNSYLVELELD